MAVITLDQVCKRYPGSDELAVDHLSFTVEDGEFMVLLGPSGCGKSTTLRLIAGLESITSGTLSIDGRVMNTVPARSRDIAMVFQSYALYPHMNIYNNLAFGLRRRGISRKETRSRVESVAETLGLSSLLTRRPHSLSGGQRQRVALGRAIVRDPKIFLFDEPLSNLDTTLRVSTRNELIQQHQRLGATMVYVTHDQLEAMTMGTRICILNQGKIVQLGQPLDVYSHPADSFVAQFLGNPRMNMLETRLESSEGRPGVRCGGKVLPLDPDRADDLDALREGEILLGIRPEDIYEIPPASNSGAFIEFQAIVRTLETLGAETLLGFELEGRGERIVARVGRDSSARIGSGIRVFFDVSRIHLFDPQSTRSVYPTRQ